jgi:hypothetical protein
MLFEFLAWLTVNIKVIAKPNFLLMRLVLVTSQNLLNSIGLFGLLVETHPYQGKSTPTQQFVFLET